MNNVIDFPNSHILVGEQVLCVVNSLLYCSNSDFEEQFLVGMVAVSIGAKQHAIVVLDDIEAVLTPKIAELVNIHVKKLNKILEKSNSSRISIQETQLHEQHGHNDRPTFKYSKSFIKEGESPYIIVHNLLKEVAFFGSRR